MQVFDAQIRDATDKFDDDLPRHQRSLQASYCSGFGAALPHLSPHRWNAVLLTAACQRTAPTFAGTLLTKVGTKDIRVKQEIPIERSVQRGQLGP